MVTIPRQFNGPPASGNGGWVSGLVAREALAHRVPGPARARLSAPPPLEVPLAWEHNTDEVRLVTHGGALVASATSGSFAQEAPAAPTHEEAAAGHANYPGFTSHPFNTCFTCGTGREEGDGLRLFTGLVDQNVSGRVAGPWRVHPAFGDDAGRVSDPVVWAALDCPGGWSAGMAGRALVLGTMTAQIVAPVVVGRDYRSVGVLLEDAGRKQVTATALYDENDQLVGRAEQVWIEIDPATFGS